MISWDLCGKGQHAILSMRIFNNMGLRFQWCLSVLHQHCGEKHTLTDYDNMIFSSFLPSFGPFSSSLCQSVNLSSISLFVLWGRSWRGKQGQHRSLPSPQTSNSCFHHHLLPQHHGDTRQGSYYILGDRLQASRQQHNTAIWRASWPAGSCWLVCLPWLGPQDTPSSTKPSTINSFWCHHFPSNNNSNAVALVVIYLLLE